MKPADCAKPYYDRDGRALRCARPKGHPGECVVFLPPPAPPEAIALGRKLAELHGWGVSGREQTDA